jgi:hypothetical protein
MGATVDPQTGELVWQFHVPLAAQRVYYAAHPPSTIGTLRVTPATVDHIFDGHGEPVSLVYAVACPCGTDAFTVLVHEGSEAPAILECAACGDQYEIFDPTEHGYDGALGNNAGIELPEPETIDAAPSSFEAPYQVLVRFEFASDQLGGEDLGVPAEDLFTWITIVGKSGDKLETLFDAECA